MELSLVHVIMLDTLFQVGKRNTEYFVASNDGSYIIDNPWNLCSFCFLAYNRNTPELLSQGMNRRIC